MNKEEPLLDLKMHGLETDGEESRENPGQEKSMNKDTGTEARAC